MNNPWEHTSVWKSKSQYFNWIRGELRRMWSNYPIRNEFLTASCRPVTQEERAAGKFHRQTKTVGQCVFCLDWFPKSKLEVDHKQCSGGCKSREEAEKFLWYCGAAVAEDIQLACRSCHKISTYSERAGITFEEAVIEKQVVVFGKLKADEQHAKLKQLYLPPATNANARKQKFREYLKGLQS